MANLYEVLREIRELAEVRNPPVPAHQFGQRLDEIKSVVDSGLGEIGEPVPIVDVWGAEDSREASRR